MITIGSQVLSDMVDQRSKLTTYRYLVKQRRSTKKKATFRTMGILYRQVDAIKMQEYLEKKESFLDTKIVAERLSVYAHVALSKQVDSKQLNLFK